MVNLNTRYNSCMYNYYYSIQDFKKPGLQPRRVNQKFVSSDNSPPFIAFGVRASSMSGSKDSPKPSETGVTRSGKPGTILKSRLHQNLSSHDQERKQKTSLFSSLLLVNFPAFRFSWIAIRQESTSYTFYEMEAFLVCKNVNHS